MNLLTQAIENIYKNGNATLYIERYKSRIIFETSKTGNLNIKVEINYADENLCDSYELTVEEGLSHIAYLVYYSYSDFARKRDIAYLTTEMKENKSEATIGALNELHNQLLPMISIDRNHIESLAKSRGSSSMLYASIANSSVYVDGSSQNLTIKDIIESLVKKYDIFEKTLCKATKLWKSLGTGSKTEANEAFNEWNKLLNELYIFQFNDTNKIDINSIDIDYEFLTSKNYLSNPAVDCEEELESLEIALLTPSKSALLVGPPGTGKTAIVEGLAYQIINQQVPQALQDKKILKVNTSSIVRGCSLVGMFEAKVEKIMKYLIENPDTILFIDEMHTAIGLGAGNKSNLDLANLMKPYLDRGVVKVVSATTDEEYEEYVKTDKAFNRRLLKVKITEPEKKKVCRIIWENIKKLEKTTNVKWNFDPSISEIIINHIAECTKEKNRVYNDKKSNPDISLTILEMAFAMALLTNKKNISVENIATAIRRSDFLYESVRTESANDLLNKCQKTSCARRRIIQFPVQPRFD